MTGLPNVGDKVTIYPAPGRMIQDGHLPLDSGGRWLKGPREIKWTQFHLEQYRAGDLFLHALPAEEKHDKKPEAPKGKE